MTKLRLLFFFLITLLVITISTPLLAASTTLSPTDDLNNHGQQVGLINVSKWKHGFFRFDIRELEGEITNATFRVHYEGNNQVTFYIGGTEDDDWSEATNTTPDRIYIHDDPSLQLDSVILTANSGPKYIEFSVTDFVNAQATADGIVTLELSSNRNSWNAFSSKEGPNQPELVINKTPPSSGQKRILFDDNLQNGASFYSANGSTSDFAPVGEPIFVGSESIKLVMDSWTQAGIGINQTAPATNQLLEAMVYRAAGSQGTFGLRYGSGWVHLNLTDDNSEFWTIDGAPGNYAFTDDAWHKLVIDLDGLGVAAEIIHAMMVKSNSGSDTFYMDEVAFVTSTPPTNIPPAWVVPNPMTLTQPANLIMAVLQAGDGSVSDDYDFQALVTDPDDGPEDLHISQVNGAAVDPIAGLAGTVTFTHSADTFSADFTVMQDGNITVSNVGDMTTIPPGESATATVTMHVADDGGAETDPPLEVILEVTGEAVPANQPPVWNVGSPQMISEDAATLIAGLSVFGTNSNRQFYR